MSNTRTMLAMLALGAAVAFAGPAFAEKMKATLDGKSEVPAERQRRHGHRRHRLRCRHQEADLEADLFGALRSRDRRAFPRARRSRQERRRRGRDPECRHQARLEGSATLTDAQAADLMAGKYYINVHTAANPGGEIRGQVTK